MIILDKSMKELFQIFCKENSIDDMQTAIKYFTIFGGLDIKIDTSKSILELIEKHILNNYSQFRSEINQITGGYPVNHAVLSGIALGDRKATNAFKRAFVSFEEGMKCVNELYKKEIVDIESSEYFLAGKTKDENVSQKLLFVNPFLRFWFAFISPIYKGIRDGDYKEFKERFENRESGFSDFIFEELALSFIKNSFPDRKIRQHGQFWDENIHIQIIAKTEEGKTIVGFCKYSDNKVKKSELNKFIQKLEDENIYFDIVTIFAKNGFSNELKNVKSEYLKLFNTNSLKALIS